MIHLLYAATKNTTGRHPCPASDEASFVTGSGLLIDGGSTAG